MYATADDIAASSSSPGDSVYATAEEVAANAPGMALFAAPTDPAAGAAEAVVRRDGYGRFAGGEYEAVIPDPEAAVFKFQEQRAGAGTGSVGSLPKSTGSAKSNSQLHVTAEAQC